MNFNAVLALLFAGLCCCACAGDDEIVPGKKQLVFSATSDSGKQMPSGDSDRKHTALQSDKSVTFVAGDAISVFDGAGNNKFATADAGASATFYGSANNTTNYTALYPYQEDATLSGTTLTATLPVEQIAQVGTFDPAAALSVGTTTSDEMAFAMKNVCAIVKFETTEPLNKLVFKSNGGEKIAGKLSIDVSATPTATGDAESVTLVSPSPTTTFPAGTYYLMILPQELSEGFTLEAYKDGSCATADYALNMNVPVTFTRSRILNIGTLEHDSFNDHAYVDLGIEVNGYKVLWATMNLGATTETDYGDYYAWGEIEPKSTEYAWTDYKLCNGTSKTLKKYCYKSNYGYNKVKDALAQLELVDDAAHQTWGGDWVIPTTEEWRALKENTTSEWTQGGRRFTSKTDPTKSIYLPAGGVKSSSSVRQAGTTAYYWSSSLDVDGEDPRYAYTFHPGEMGVSATSSDYRFYGELVRPVVRVAK